MAVRQLLAFLVLMSAGAGAWAQAPGMGTWLVLPLVNTSDKKNFDWIGEAVGEAMREELRLRGEMVVERAGQQEAERRLAVRSNRVLTVATVLKLAEAVDATHVVFGTCAFAGGSSGGSLGSLSLAVQVLAVNEFRTLAKHDVGGAVEDLATLQTQLAGKVAGNLGSRVSGGLGSRLRISAIESYTRGLMAEDSAEKRKFWEQAAKIEPRYSQACFQLGRLFFEEEQFGEAAAWLRRVQSGDSHYWQASFLLGLALLETRDAKGSVVAFDRVFRELPLPEVANNLGIAQMLSGMPESAASLRRAIEGDDRDPTYHFNLGLEFMTRGEWASAADQFRATLDREQGDADATKLLGRCLKPPPALTQAIVEELQEQARPKFEFNEFAYRQFKAILLRQAKP